MDSLKDLTFMTLAARVSAFAIIGYVFYGIYRLWMNGVRYKKPSPECVNKVAIITGASHGIGKQVAYEMAARGLQVILACRNEIDGIQAQNEIIAMTGNENIIYMHLDLSSFRSIHNFATKFLNTGSKLDILINNANMVCAERELTEDGLEKTIGVNHFGPFLLTMLLLKRLSQATPSRIIHISHWLHRFYDIDQMDVMNKNQYNSYEAYAQSQLASVYFSFALGRRLLGTGITSNVLHPGVSINSLIERSHLPNYLRNALVYLANVLLKSEEACAESIVYAALDFSLQNISGLYLSDSQIGACGKNAENEELGEWLWRKSEDITGVRFDKSVLEAHNPFK